MNELIWWVCVYTGMDGRAIVVATSTTQQHDRNHRRGAEAVETGAGSHQRVSCFNVLYYFNLLVAVT